MLPLLRPPPADATAYGTRDERLDVGLDDEREREAPRRSERREAGTRAAVAEVVVAAAEAAASPLGGRAAIEKKVREKGRKMK